MVLSQWLLLFSAISSCALGVDEPEATRMTVLVGETRELNRDFTKVDVDKGLSGIAEVNHEQNRLLISGKAPGMGTIAVITKDGKREGIRVVVYRPILLPLGRSKIVRMASGQPIRSVDSIHPGAEVERLKDNPSAVAVRAREAGDFSIVLIGEDQRAEPILLFVRSDKVAGKNAVLMPPGDFLFYHPAGLGDLTSVENHNEGVVEVRPGIRNSVRLSAVAPGVAWVDLADKAGKATRVEVVVAARAPINAEKEMTKAPAGKPIPLQMATKRPINYVDIHSANGDSYRYVFKSDAQVPDKGPARPVETPARDPGIYIYVLHDKDGKEEMRKIQVVEETKK